MLSPSEFLTAGNYPPLPDIEARISKLCREKGLICYILCSWSLSESSFDVIAAWPVDVEPLRGAQRVHVELLIRDIIEKFPKIHCHAISHLGIPNVLHRLKGDIQGISRCWYIPLNIEGAYYIFLGFPAMSVTDKNIPDAFVSQLIDLLSQKDAEVRVSDLTAKMRVTEQYVKEVGHDIASAVQATIAKLRNIQRGLIPEAYIKEKAGEAELEIMAAYRVADGLGLTMQPNYQVREFKPFDLISVCENALELHRSESGERHISFDVRQPQNKIILIGDRQAFEQVVGHLLSNAIKYAFGGSRVFVNITSDNEYAEVKVINVGIPLPVGDDFSRIWEFGFRGKEAVGRHVNGSGIGLFTVKKIVLAHNGTVSGAHDPTSKRTTFALKVPLASYLRKTRADLFVDAIASGSMR